MPMKRISLDVPQDLCDQIDETRGLVPRNVWLRELIEQRLTPSPPVSTTQKKVRAAEPAPSKPLPTVANVAVEAPSEFLEAYGRGQAEPKIATVGSCSHPKSKRSVHGWGTLCGLCGEKVS